MFIDLNCFLRWAMWPMGLLFKIKFWNVLFLEIRILFNVQLSACTNKKEYSFLFVHALSWLYGSYIHVYLFLNKDLTCRRRFQYNNSDVRCAISYKPTIYITTVKKLTKLYGFFLMIFIFTSCLQSYLVDYMQYCKYLGHICNRHCRMT